MFLSADVCVLCYSNLRIDFFRISFFTLLRSNSCYMKGKEKAHFLTITDLGLDDTEMNLKTSIQNRLLLVNDDAMHHMVKPV